MKKLRKILIISVLLIGFIWCLVPSQIYNSKYRLNIVSSYGDNEPYHPKVLTFDEAWNGYKYWMSYTPYPEGDDSKENPEIVASNDLITWEVPEGLNNPLDTPADTRPQLRYNSESHIVYNDDLDRMEVYWRYVDDVEDKAIMYRMATEDGVNWSEKEIAFVASPRSKIDYVSPAIIYMDGIYKMWYVDKNNTLKYTTSTDGKNWAKPTIINLKYEEKVKTWHIDVISTEKGYEMISVAYKDWASHNDMSLYYTKSEDGINWQIAKVIIRPTIKTSYWDNKGIYRSSFVLEDGIYYVYYSGTSKDYHHGIGLMYGEDIYDLKHTNTDYTDLKDVEKLKNKIEKVRKK